MLDILVTFVFADEIVEMVPVKECCQLGEYKLVFEHKQSLKGCKGANSSPLTLKTDRKRLYFSDFKERLVHFNGTVVTSTKKVYKFVDTYWTGVAFGGRNTSGYCYYAVSNDKETLIYWYENTSNEIRDKKYYTRVDVKDLAPKPANRDFLYE